MAHWNVMQRTYTHETMQISMCMRYWTTRLWLQDYPHAGYKNKRIFPLNM